MHFLPLFLQTFAIISKTVYYLFLIFCRNLRHNKGLGMECSFWPYNSFLVQNRPKSAFLGPIFEIWQIFPNFFFKFKNFFLVQNEQKMDQKCQKCQNSLKSAFFAPFLPFFAVFCNYLKNTSLFLPNILQELKAQ